MIMVMDFHFLLRKINNSICFYCIYNWNMTLITSKRVQIIFLNRLKSSLTLYWRVAEETNRVTWNRWQHCQTSNPAPMHGAAEEKSTQKAKLIQCQVSKQSESRTSYLNVQPTKSLQLGTPLHVLCCWHPYPN